MKQIRWRTVVDKLPLNRSTMALAAFAVFVLAATVACLMEAYFWCSAYDFGLHVQAIWKLSRFQGLFNTVRGMNIWGDHAWFIMILFAVPYRIFSSPYLLLVMQAGAIASGMLAVYFIAEHRGLGQKLSFLLGVL